MMKKQYGLPSMDHKFSIQVIGDESGINWVGDFLYRRPTLYERTTIDVLRARLNGDLVTIDADVRAFNEAYAHLRWTLKEYPDWWKESDFGGALYDANVLLEVYNKAVEFEANWRRKVHGGDSKKVEAGNEEPVGATP